MATPKTQNKSGIKLKFCGMHGIKCTWCLLLKTLADIYTSMICVLIIKKECMKVVWQLNPRISGAGAVLVFILSMYPGATFEIKEHFTIKKYWAVFPCHCDYIKDGKIRICIPVLRASGNKRSSNASEHIRQNISSSTCNCI